MPEGLSEEELQEIEDRLNAARVGPWAADWGDASPYTGSPALQGVYTVVKDCEGLTIATVWENAPRSVPTDDMRNGEFIAHAPEDVRRLIDEIRRLKAGGGFG